LLGLYFAEHTRILHPPNTACQSAAPHLEDRRSVRTGPTRLSLPQRLAQFGRVHLQRNCLLQNSQTLYSGILLRWPKVLHLSPDVGEKLSPDFGKKVCPDAGKELNTDVGGEKKPDVYIMVCCVWYMVYAIRCMVYAIYSYHAMPYIGCTPHVFGVGAEKMKPSESSSLALAHANLIDKTLHLEVQQLVMAPRERTVVTLRQKVQVLAQCRRVALLGGVLTAVSRRGVAGVTGIEQCEREANVQRKSTPHCGCIRTVHFLLSRLYLPRARGALLYLQHGAARKSYQCLPAFAIRVGTLICICVRVHKYVRVVCGRYRHMGVRVNLCTVQYLLVYKCMIYQ